MRILPFGAYQIDDFSLTIYDWTLVNSKRLFLFLLVLLLLPGCERPSNDSAPAPTQQAISDPTLAATPTQLPSTPSPTPPTATPTSPPTPTPFYTGDRSLACGQLLPLLPQTAVSPAAALNTDPALLEQIRQVMPELARPAFEQWLAAPESVGLVAYRLDQPEQGIYHNPDVSMPLASVVKIITLVAYAEAVAAGELNPLEPIPLAEIDAFDLPRTNLGAHSRAVEELEEAGKLNGEPPTVLLEELPWMMMRHSSNAASDYLHLRLGQQRIEETAVSLGLTSQTAPCPFLAQFLAMANHATPTSLRGFLADPASYGDTAMLLADAYVSSEAFRLEEQAWRGNRSRPSFTTQYQYSHTFDPQASPRQYASLMARLAQNGLSSGDASFTARLYLEWPMRVFPINQELFTNLGYKNGTLPGILTTTYYAYPADGRSPIVVTLFYRDLPNSVYRDWRFTLPHDDFARWLLIDPQAIPLLRQLTTAE